MAFHQTNVTASNGQWLTAGHKSLPSSVSDSALSESSSDMIEFTKSKSAARLPPIHRSASTSPNFSVRLRHKKENRNNIGGGRPKSMGLIGSGVTHQKGSQHPHNRMSLMEALNDKKVKAALRLFLQSEYSLENLDFWSEAEDYKKLKNADERRRAADMLYRTYIANGAPLQINLDHYNRGRIAEELCTDGTPSREMFVGAQKYIYNILENDSYARFVRSKHFEVSRPPSRRSPRAIFRDIFPSRRKQGTPTSRDNYKK